MHKYSTFICYLQICAYDIGCVQKGTLFQFPITVIVPERLVVNNSFVTFHCKIYCNSIISFS